MDEKKTSLVENITLTSVPADQRKSWPSIAFIWAGSVICIPALMVGSLISAGMNFKQSALCMVIGYVLVVFYMCLMGIQSSDLGLPATVAISRAYGKRGSSFLVSLVIAVCMIGWFAAQTSLCASSFCNIMSGYFHVNFPLWLSVIIWGCLMFITSVYGVKLIEFLNKVSVPALFVMLIWGVISCLMKGAAATVLAYEPPAFLGWTYGDHHRSGWLCLRRYLLRRLHPLLQEPQRHDPFQRGGCTARRYRCAAGRRVSVPRRRQL